MEIYFKKRPGASFLSKKYRKCGLVCQGNLGRKIWSAGLMLARRELCLLRIEMLYKLGK